MYILKIGVRDCEDRWHYYTTFKEDYESCIPAITKFLYENKSAGYDKISLSIKEAVVK